MIPRAQDFKGPYVLQHIIAAKNTPTYVWNSLFPPHQLINNTNKVADQQCLHSGDPKSIVAPLVPVHLYIQASAPSHVSSIAFPIGPFVSFRVNKHRHPDAHLLLWLSWPSLPPTICPEIKEQMLSASQLTAQHLEQLGQKGDLTADHGRLTLIDEASDGYHHHHHPHHHHHYY